MRRVQSPALARPAQARDLAGTLARGLGGTLARGIAVALARGLAVTLALGLGACVFNHESRREHSRAASSPLGETITFRFTTGTAQDQRTEERTAELLEVRADGVLIGTDSTIQHVFFDRLVSPRITDPASYRVRSRYPQGLTDAQLRLLLRATGLARVDTVGASARLAPPAEVRPDPAMLETFLRQAEAAAAPYRSLENAVAAGFRRLGPAFPGMGEHWIHPGRIVAGHIDPARPPVLCYAPIQGEHRLVALAFTVPLDADEPPPEYPAGAAAWHDHDGHVDEESLLLVHRHSHQGADGPRLAMFHAWLWLDNPDGVLAQNNWRLPFVQAGLDAGGLRPSADAARALSLHTAGPDYYLTLFLAAAALEPAEIDTLARLLAHHAGAARAWATTAPAPLDVHALAELETLWGDVWREIRSAVRAPTWESLAILRH
jgi:hypothetical protein